MDIKTGEDLKTYRAQHGLTQKRVAELLYNGLTNHTICRMERKNAEVPEWVSRLLNYSLADQAGC
jgi:transcriptional regulator with XRE-family HTH domain